MNRSIFCIAVACAVLAPRSSFADDAAPSAADLAAAKKAYAEGKALHDKGNLPDAVEKFKESYRLSKNPLLLYNIAFTMDEAGTKDLALFYYKKFLTDAPPDATQRASVTERVKLLEKDTTAKSDEPKADEPKADKPKSNIKPAGTYTATDFGHQVIEEAPPGKPLDVTASVPDDSGFIVTLYFRGSGESNFTARVMKPRYKELVARIPAAKMAGTAIQYYVECKDAAGAVVTRSGKSTEPNLVTIEATATAKFYPDIVDEAPPPTQSTGDNDDPLNKKTQQVDTNPVVNPPAELPTHGGFMDVGSSKFTYAKYGTTIGAATFFGLSVLFYVRAKNAADALATDASSCGSPPCRKFDTDYDADIQSGGKRDALLFDIGLGLGAATAVVAGYFWYKEHQAKKSGDMKVSGNAAPAAASWVLSPMADGSTIGAAAVGRF